MADAQAGNPAPAAPAVSAFSTPPPEMSREEILHEGQQGLRDFCIIISFLALLLAGVMVAVNNGAPNQGAGIAIAGVGFYVISRVGT